MENEVRASSHVAMSTSINKALHIRFLEKGSVMLCLWMSHDHLHEPHCGGFKPLSASWTTDTRY